MGSVGSDSITSHTKGRLAKKLLKESLRKRLCEIVRARLAASNIPTRLQLDILGPTKVDEAEPKFGTRV